MGFGARERHRISVKSSVVTKAHKAERLRERRVAITAELRAIGIEPDTQRMRLTRVTAAQVRAAERSRRDAGGIRLRGAIFPREGKQWMA